MKILVLNAGSSSIKYQLFNTVTQQALVRGTIECIGEHKKGHLKHDWRDDLNLPQRNELFQDIPDHHVALELIIRQLQDCGVLAHIDDLDAIGHRIVHGGDIFQQPVLIDEQVTEAVRHMIPLAPLHNPANLEGVEVSQRLFPDTPQIAVFDTAFHQTMPEVAYHYAIPGKLCESRHIRRYGFHGTSHHYVAKRASQHMGRKLSELNMITLHLGNGCSATAIEAGKSVDTSMGMTPLEGLMMGTRSGDVDPALHFYLQREVKLSLGEIELLLTKRSGLKGTCGISDMREIQLRARGGDKSAQLAEALFIYHIKKYIGAYAAILGRLDALVFTGGIGENSAYIREKVCERLDILGIQADPEKNQQPWRNVLEFQKQGSPVCLLTIPTNEELEIANSSAALLQAGLPVAA